jgi:sugar diacid utilization regulator
MSVRMDQLISLPYLQNLKLVGGGKGIYRIIRWVHIMETPDLVVFVQNNELIILTGVGILDNKESFIELLKGLIEKKAAGLIVNVGKYLKQVPEYIKELADDNDFPIFELPWEVSLAEITRIICSEIVKRHLEETSFQDLLMNIIFFNKITFDDFTERVSSFGYNSLNSFRIAIVEIDNFQQFLSSKNIKDEQKISHSRDTFLRSVNSAIWDSMCRPISFFQNDSVILLLINEKEKFINLEMLSDMIRQSSRSNSPENTISIGFGNVYTEFSEIKRSYMEAEKALKALKAEGKTDGTMFYSKIGVYKLLTEIEDKGLLKEYYNDTVGKLEKYDAQNATNFSEIFYVFLKENGNYIKTSQKLFMHRNTLLYKINKIQEIIKTDLTDTKVRFEFYLGYLVKQINDF